MLLNRETSDKDKNIEQESVSFCCCCVWAVAPALPRSLKIRHISSFSHLKAPNLRLRKHSHGEVYSGKWWPSIWRLGWASAVEGDTEMQISSTPRARAGLGESTRVLSSTPKLSHSIKKSYRGGNRNEVRNSLLFCSFEFDMINSDNANLGCLPASVHCSGAAGFWFSGSWCSGDERHNVLLGCFGGVGMSW